MLTDHRIAAKSCLLTTRAAKWATVQVGTGRTVSEVAGELDCDWHTINDAVTTYGEALLAADRKRLNRTAAIGLDETSFVRLADHHTSYATTVCDVAHHQIIDILPSRNYVDVAGFLDKQPAAWKNRITFGALDMSATYAAVYTVVLPKTAQVVDAFHVISLANRALDAVRRRVQTEQTGHRGRRDDPLYRARRVLLVGEERLTDKAALRLASLLTLARPQRRGRDRLPGQRTTPGVLPHPRTTQGSSDARRARRALPATHHAAGATKARPDPSDVVRQDRQLPPRPDQQRTHRSAEQPHQTHQTDRLRLPQLRQLPHPRPALRRQTQLARPQLDRGPVNPTTPLKSEEPLWEHAVVTSSAFPRWSAQVQVPNWSQRASRPASIASIMGRVTWE